MALTLAQIKAVTTDNLQAGLVESMINQNPLISLCPFVDNQGHHTYTYTLIDDASGDTTRAINADFAEGTATFQKRSFSLGILGGKAYVDGYLEATSAPVDALSAQVAAKAKQTALRFQNEFFNGDTAVDPNGFDGLKKLSLFSDLGPAKNISLDDLDLALDNVNGNASVIVANQKTASQLTKLARNNVHLSDVDMVGVRLQAYNGVPIVRVGKFGANQVLDDGEIYAIKLGEDGVFGVQASTPTPSVYAPNSERPGWTVRIDWYVGLAAKVGSYARVTRKLP